MEHFCYGCMKKKQSRPICEHCGYDDRWENPHGSRSAGTIIGNRYLLGRKIDICGADRAYIGMDLKTNEVLRIREYLPFEDQKNAIYRQQHLLRELYFANQLRHIPEVYGPEEYLEEDGFGFLIYKELEWPSLIMKVRRRKVAYSPSEILSLLRPLMEALERVHQQDIFHGRISPGDIFVDEENHIKLAGPWVYDKEEMNRLAQQCIPIDAETEAPELRLGKAGPWSDVYSICEVIYYCLTGHTYWRDLDNLNIDWDTVKGLTNQQRSALRRGSEYIYQNRTQSMKQLIEDLFGEPFVSADSFRYPEDIPLGGAVVYEPEAGKSEPTKGIRALIHKWKKKQH